MDSIASVFRFNRLTEDAPGYTHYEHHITCNSPVRGSLELCSIRLRPVEFETQPHRPYIHLHLTLPGFTYGTDQADFLKEQSYTYVTGGSSVDEFTWILSTFFRRQFRSSATIRIGLSPTFYEYRQSSSLPWNEEPIFLPEVRSFFEAFEGLQQPTQRRAMLACRLYSSALTSRISDPELSYTTLVSALECLLDRVPEPDMDTDIAEAISQVTCPTQQMKLLQIVGQQRKISARFRRLAEYLLDDSFYIVRKGVPSSNMLTAETMPKILRDVYEARSKFLHEGTPFLDRIRIVSRDNEELPYGLTLKKKPSGKEPPSYWPAIPTLAALDRLTSHAIRSYVSGLKGESNIPLK